MIQLREFILRFSLFFISLLLACLLCEVALRLFYPQKLSYNVTKWDGYVGFVNIPNVRGFSRNQDFNMQVQINSKGLRDREFEYKKKPGVFRIGVFGDSFTFGEGVQNDETYAKQLERLLESQAINNALTDAIEVLNFGIGKTGTSHQLAFMRKEGVKYHLDLIILGFLSGNDFDDNWGGVFSLDGQGNLIHNENKYSLARRMQRIVYKIPFYEWLAGHSHLVNLIRKSVSVYDDKRRMFAGIKKNATNEVHTEIPQKQDVQRNEAQYKLTLRLIDEFKAESAEAGAQFLFLNLPTRTQELSSKYPEGKVPDTVKMSERLMSDLRSEGLSVFDLVPEFSRAQNRPSYYFPNDGHINREGHALVARSLKDFLLANKIIPQR